MLHFLTCGCSWDDGDSAWVPCAAHRNSPLDAVKKSHEEIVEIQVCNGCGLPGFPGTSTCVFCNWVTA